MVVQAVEGKWLKVDSYDITQKISLWNEAIDKAKSNKPSFDLEAGEFIDYQPTEQEIYSEYLKLAKIFKSNPFQLEEDNSLQELEKEMTNRSMQNDPLLNPTGGSLLWDSARLWKNTNK